MKIKKTHPNRKSASYANYIRRHRAALARVNRICPASTESAANAEKKPTRYVINSAEVILSLHYGAGCTEPAWARATIVTDSLTGNVVATTVHFEPGCDLASAGGDVGYLWWKGHGLTQGFLVGQAR